MMRIRVLLTCVVSWILIISVLTVAHTQAGEQAGAERTKNLEKLLQVATDRFELGRYIECKAALDKLYALHPTDEECWKLREVFGDRILRHMAFWVHKGRTLGDAPVELLRRSQVFEQARLLDPKNIEAVVKAVTTQPEQVREMQKLALIGAFAVPYLVNDLRAGTDDVIRTNASVLLVNLGPQVVVPVTEALRSNDDVLLQHLCEVLRKIKPADPRALHQIKRIYDNTKNLPTVRAFAKRALEEIAQAPAANQPLAAEYMYREANRVYLGGPIVAEEMMDLSGAFWIWDQKAMGGKGFLRHAKVPIFELDDLTVQELAYQGIRLTKNPRRFQVLLASSMLAQAAEIQELSAILKLRGITMPHVKVLQGDIEKWMGRLYRNEYISWTVGSSMLLDVLDKALLDGKGSVAVKAMEGIRKIAGPRGWSRIEGYRPDLKESTVTDGRQDAGKAEAGKDVKARAKSGKRTKPEAVAGNAAKKQAAPQTGGAAESVAMGNPDHPLLTALSHPDRRVRYAAANCLKRIGLPPQHPRYKDLVPVLVDGARENAAIVCLVISNNPKTREHMARMLASKGFLAMTAPTGREGYSLATQFPPKDAIIIDSEVEEFAYLRQQLQLRHLVSASSLPLVIITTRGRAEKISRQFSRKQWEINFRFNVSAEDQGKFVRLYNDLTYQRRSTEKKKSLAILTNEDAKVREALQQAILLEAERRGRPERQTDILKMMHKKKLLSDIFAVRSMFVNVFLDDELSGFNAMRTVQALRRDPRTQHIPVALLTSFGPQGRAPHVRKDFEKFLTSKADARLMDYEVDANDLMNEVKDMTNLNVLSKEHYVRKLYDRIALDSARALTDLDIQKGGLSLNEQQVQWLMGVLGDASRAPELRAQVAAVLGHFKAERAMRSLIRVFRDEDKKHVALRAACIDALGKIDTANKHMQVKLDALDDPAPEIQEAACGALSIAQGGMVKNQAVLDAKRPNAPLDLLSGKPAAAPKASEKPAPDEDEKPKEDAGEKEGEDKEDKGDNKEDKDKPDEDDGW